MFGNVFDRPLKLPWGFSAALKFMKYVQLFQLKQIVIWLIMPRFIDPTLEQDLTSKSKPWALSPLIATMPHFTHRRMDENHRLPQFPPKKPITDDVSQLPTLSNDHHQHPKRRSYFQSAAKRKEVSFGPQVWTNLNSLRLCSLGLHLLLCSLPVLWQLSMDVRISSLQTSAMIILSSALMASTWNSLLGFRSTCFVTGMDSLWDSSAVKGYRRVLLGTAYRGGRSSGVSWLKK